MQQVEKTEQLFEELKAGRIITGEVLFEAIWLNFATLAREPEARSLLYNIYEWSKAHTEKYPELFELTNLTIGTIEFLADNFDEAMKYLNTAHLLFADKGNEDGVAATFISIGYVYRTTGEIDLALKHGLQGLEQLVRTGKYKLFRILGCYWIGSVYTETGHLDDALHLFKSGLMVAYPAGLKSMGARLTNGIAGVYMKQKSYSLALEYYQKALDLCDVTTERTFRARGLTDLGDYYFVMGNYQQAIDYNQQALAIRQEMKIQNGSVTNLMNLGNIFKMQGRFDEAIAVLLQALKLAEEIRVKVKMYQVHQLLSDIYLVMGNPSESLAHYMAFHVISEAVNHEDMQHKVKNQIQLFQAEQTKRENVIITAQKNEIEKEKQRSDELLLNILPDEVAEELKSKGSVDARQFDVVSVLFTDFIDFTRLSENLTPRELVEEIHTCFKAFDQIIEKCNLEKIKTIGDSYMCAGGLPMQNNTNAADAVRAALAISRFMDERAKQRAAEGKEPFHIRMGIHTGPVVAGIVGTKKFAYDIWGDTVNMASRMESSGEAGKVNISSTTYELVKDQFKCTYRGKIQAKGKGKMMMYFVEGPI
ncbi:MAG: tetratricopeptide repeat protein [Chitinophagaceae bacterium]|nr:tetratricopeptide repeat protein [Chitinophagaceae bacterium]